MQRAAFVIALSGAVIIMWATEAAAQNSRARGAALGAATGALIGGATSSRTGRGALIGGAVGLGVGSLIGGQMERRRGNHYWYNGRCWRRFPNNEFHPVSNRYCR